MSRSSSWRSLNVHTDLGAQTDHFIVSVFKNKHICYLKWKYFWSVLFSFLIFLRLLKQTLEILDFLYKQYLKYPKKYNQSKNNSAEYWPVVQHILDFGKSGCFCQQKSSSTLKSSHFSISLIYQYTVSFCRFDSSSFPNMTAAMKRMQSQTSQKTNPVINVFFEIDKEQNWQAVGLTHNHTSLTPKRIPPCRCSTRYFKEVFDQYRAICEDSILIPQARANKFVARVSETVFTEINMCHKTPGPHRSAVCGYHWITVAFLLPN